MKIIQHLGEIEDNDSQFIIFGRQIEGEWFGIIPKECPLGKIKITETSSTFVIDFTRDEANGERA